MPLGRTYAGFLRAFGQKLASEKALPKWKCLPSVNLTRLFWVPIDFFSDLFAAREACSIERFLRFKRANLLDRPVSHPRPLGGRYSSVI